MARAYYYLPACASIIFTSGRDLLLAVRDADLSRERLLRFAGLGCKGWAAVAADSWTLDGASFLAGELSSLCYFPTTHISMVLDVDKFARMIWTNLHGQGVARQHPGHFGKPFKETPRTWRPLWQTY